MTKLIKVFSSLIILLGLIHIGFALPLEAATYTLWFVGAGFAIIFAGMLNWVALDRGGSRFTNTVALAINLIGTAGFCLALPILNQPQVYVGIGIFLVPAVAFFIRLISRRS